MQILLLTTVLPVGNEIMIIIIIIRIINIIISASTVRIPRPWRQQQQQHNNNNNNNNNNCCGPVTAVAVINCDGMVFRSNIDDDSYVQHGV